MGKKDAGHWTTALKKEVESLKKERDAFKKAKEENDERFMRERDDARAEVEKLQAAWEGHAAPGGDWEQISQKVKDLEKEIEVLQKANSQLVDEKDKLVETLKVRTDVNQATLARSSSLEELNEELVKDAERWKNDYMGACKLVADMHAAAVGEVTGPNVGPVEDVAALRAEFLKLKDSTRTGLIAEGILADIQAERARQDAKWGEQNHPDGTGGTTARGQADAAKSICNHFAKLGKITWMQILTEEMLEAFAETDPKLLREELIQSAAVATAWAECIDRRQRGK